MSYRHTPGGLVFCLGMAWRACFAASDRPDVLFLNSYHPGLYWSDQVQEGVRRSLGPHESFAVEHLDSKHFEGPRGDSLFAAEFRYKYAAHPPRLIVSSDDYALRFLLRWRDNLFPGIPVVFCGVNDFQPGLLAGHKGYTGVLELSQSTQTIELWKRLDPGITDVWVVTEHSATGTGNRTRLDSLAALRPDGLRFHFFDSGSGITWSELLSKVSKLGPQDLVYWSELYHDRNGLYIDPDQDLPEFVLRSAVPVATYSELYVVSGAAGGVCNRGLLHGQQAGRIMRRILSGESADAIPVEDDSSISPLFRWEALRRFGLDPDRLPESTKYLGKPVPVWRAYPWQSAMTLAGILVLLAMAAGLVETLRRMRKSRLHLQRSERDLRNVFDAITDAVIVHDRNGRVKSINPGGLRMYGVAKEEVEGLTIADLSAEQTPGTTNPLALIRQAELGRHVTFEWRAARPGTGAKFDAEVALTSMTLGGELQLVAVVRDISERVEARRLLQEAKVLLEQKVEERTLELRHSIEELEAFSYSVSHDLRTPLRAINGFASLLEDDLGASLDDEQRSHLDRIRAASTRMGRIIDDLLRLSRISTSSIQRSPVEMGALLVEVLADIVPSERQGQITIGVLPGLEADSRLLKPLWTNLVSNALKYSAKVDSPAIQIGAEENPDGWTWFIRDNGVGFDENFSHHLFKPFSRLHSSEEFSGTGIGLAIVHRIVTKHGGRIWAEGAPGQGATFRFTLG